MKAIVEQVKTKAPAKKVWRAWADMYNMSSKKDKSSSKEKGFKEGHKGYVVDKGGKKATYEITQLEPGKSFTMSWGNIFLRMFFHYSVQEEPKGSTISCRVTFRGIFAFPGALFIRKKIKTNLIEMLHRFAQQVEMPMPQRRIYR